MPTREWKAATSWGRSEISIFLAMVVPMRAPALQVPIIWASTWERAEFS